MDTQNRDCLLPWIIRYSYTWIHNDNKCSDIDTNGIYIEKRGYTKWNQWVVKGGIMERSLEACVDIFTALIMMKQVTHWIPKLNCGKHHTAYG